MNQETPRPKADQNIVLSSTAKCPSERGYCDPGEIAALRGAGMTFEQISWLVGVSISSVRNNYYSFPQSSPKKRKQVHYNISLIVQLRDEGKTFDEIAMRLGISRATASRRYHDRKNPTDTRAQARPAADPRIVVDLLRSGKSKSELSRSMNISKGTVIRILDGIRLLGCNRDIGKSWGRRTVGQKNSQIYHLRDLGYGFAELANELGASPTDIRHVYRAYSALVLGIPATLPALVQASKRSELIVELRRGGKSFTEIGCLLGFSTNCVRRCYYLQTGEEPSHLIKLNPVTVMNLRNQGTSLNKIAVLLHVSQSQIQRLVSKLQENITGKRDTYRSQKSHAGVTMRQPVLL